MCRPTGEIMENDIIVQEIDDYIEQNNLEPIEKLTLRVLKHTYVKNVQIQEDMTEVKSHAKECQENPSLLKIYRDKPKQFFKGVISFIFGIGLIHFFFRVVEIVSGLEGLLKALLP